MNTRATSGANNGAGWKLSKDIPISVVGFILAQTLGLTWFLAGQNAKLGAVIEDNTAGKVSQYTKEDARHEREFMEQKFLLLQNKIDDATRRVSVLEGQVTELLNKARAASK